MTRDVAMLHEQLAIVERDRDQWRSIARRNAVLLRQAIATLDELGHAATNVARAAQGEVA